MEKAKKIKVRMMVSISGARDDLHDLGTEAGFSFIPGEITELDPDLAKKWIEGGHAILVHERETTAIEPPETTMLPDAKARGPAKKV